MAIQTIPAFIALLCKLVLLAYALRAPRKHATTQLFIILLSLFAAHNIVEFFGLNHFASAGLDEVMQIYGRFYFVFAILFIVLLLHLSLRLSIDRWERLQPYIGLLYVPVPILELLLLSSDKLVSGFAPEGAYTIKRIAGPWYFLFEAYAVTYLLAALVYLIYGSRSNRPSRIQRLRNRWWLAALSPFLLLITYIIVANRFGAAGIPSTILGPIAMTFFLMISAYATHHYRLFEIELFLPWSKVRKQKRAFYSRTQEIVAEIANLPSVDAALNEVARLLRCPVALVGGRRPVLAMAGNGDDTIKMGQFPNEELERLTHITVAEEIAHERPALAAVMKRFGVAAIVPFHPNTKTASSWLLLGDHFSNSVYTPLDFKMAEQLFERLAELCLDKLSFLRAELVQAGERMRGVQDRLSTAEQQLQKSREENATLRESYFSLLTENRRLRFTRNTKSKNRASALLTLVPKAPDWGKTFEEQVAEFESELIRRTLKHCGNSQAAAAKLLGLKPNTLHYKINRYGISASDLDDED